MKNSLLKKKLRNFIIVYIVMSALIFTNYTFSRYIVSTDGQAVAEIAQFNVKVNDIDVVLGENFNLNLSPTSTTTGNKLAPNNKGYFEIEIDPTGTEVSLEYIFTFDLSNLDEDIKLTDITINNEKSSLTIENNTIKGDLLLPSTEKGFTEQDKLNIKIGWSWDEKEDTYNPVITNDSINVSATIRQKID